MPAIHDMRATLGEKVKEARGFLDKIETEKREFTAEEQTAYDAAVKEAEQLTANIARRERFQTLEEKVMPNGIVPGDTLPHEDPANKRHQYSVLKALREQLATREGRGAVTGLEAEVHQELLKRREGLTRSTRGVLIPWSVGGQARSLPYGGGYSQRALDQRFELERRALDTTAGTGSVPTILDASMIDILRARMVTYAMGARVLNDMTGSFAIPRQNAAASISWVAEGAAPSAESNLTIDQVTFTPHTISVYTDYTRRFMEQSNQDAEAITRNDLAAVVARGVETGGLNGSGASNQPTGILQNSNISTVAVGTNGGTPTWGNIVSMEGNVAANNADLGALGYVTDAKVRSTLKQTAKIGSTFPFFIWENGDAPLNGYRAGVTNLLPSNLTKGTGTNLHAAIFGNWNDLVYAFWSGIDIIVDPYSNSTSGTVRIVCLQDVDVNVRHPESFSKCVDIVVS